MKIRFKKGKEMLKIIFLLTIIAIVMISLFLVVEFIPHEFKVTSPTINYEGKLNDKGYSYQIMKGISESNNKFAIKMYKELSKTNGNIFFSPFSISSAMAIVYEGSNGETEKEIARVFEFPNKNILRPNYAHLLNELNNRKNCKLKTTNNLWINNKFRIKKEFENVCKEYYNADTANLDFRKPEESREIINNYIASETNNKIKDLIPSNFINPSMKIIITNTVYFKGTWKEPFNNYSTSLKNFWITKNEPIKTETMWNEENIQFSEDENLEMIDIPYKGNLTFTVLLPKNTSLKEVEENLNLDEINKLSESEKDEYVQITLPKFNMSKRYDNLIPYLENLGEKLLFSYQADLSNIDGKKDLFVNKIIHEAFINVDEKGTEAAAATAIGIKATAVMPNEKIIRIDRPFIFMIRDKNTGEILFMGRMVNPKENN